MIDDVLYSHSVGGIDAPSGVCTYMYELRATCSIHHDTTLSVPCVLNVTKPISSIKMLVQGCSTFVRRQVMIFDISFVN